VESSQMEMAQGGNR